MSHPRWCADSGVPDVCLDRAEHRSAVLPVAPDVASTAAIDVTLIELIDPPPHPQILAVFVAITEENIRTPYLIPLGQAQALVDQLGQLLRWAGGAL